MSVTANTEREFKFDVDADFDPPDLRPVVGTTVRLPEVAHHTVYLDTADHRLWARGITLRHRAAVPTGGAPGVPGTGPDPAADPGEWTLKLPVGVGPVRDTDLSERSELTWQQPRHDIPEPVRRILAGVVRRAPLVEIAELAALRRRLLLQSPDADGAWGELDDDLVTVMSGPNTGRRFRQIEVELSGERHAPPGQVDEVVGLMGRAGATPGGGSKLGAALGLHDAAPRPAPGAKAALADAVTAILAADVAVILDCDVELRRCAAAGEQPDRQVIHAARVAVRRLRAHLRTLGPVLDPVWAIHVRDELRSLGRAMGRVRDPDVLLARLQAHDDPDDQDGLEELIHLVSAERGLAVSELVTHMEGRGYLDLLERLAAAGATPPLFSATGDTPGPERAGPVMRDLVGRRWRRVDSRIGGLGADPSPGELHRVRVGAKRLRYAAEAAGPFLGGDGRRAAKRARRLQNVLGELHDSATAVVWLRELGSHPSITPTAAFVAGRMAGQAEAAAATLGPAWRQSARRVTSRRLRSAFGPG